MRCEGGGPAGVVEGALEKNEPFPLRFGVAGELELKLNAMLVNGKEEKDWTTAERSRS